MIGAFGVLMSLNDPRWGRGGDNNESGSDSQRQPNQRPQDGPPDLDQLWRDHIITVEQLRQVIHLRGYGQRDPLNEYKTEGYNLFESMVNRLRENVTAQVMRVEVSLWPVRTPTPHLADFLKYPTKPLSERATAGFLERTTRSQLRFSEGFVEAVASHLEQMRDTTPVAASNVKKSKKRPAKA